MKTILHSRLLQHSLFWTFQLILYFFTYEERERPWIGMLVTLAYLPSHLIFTYTQLYFLIPRFLLKKQVGYYLIGSAILCKIAVSIAILAAVYIINPLKSISCGFTWSMLLPVTDLQMKSVFALFTICGLAISIKLFKKWYGENNRYQDIEKEKTLMELEMLKAQVHPHFLFNTLNNLYSLTLTQSEQAPVMVSHLTGLLHYMLYECNEKQVPLDKEIAVLKKYVELEKLRYGNRINISFECSGQTSSLMIAPLLLLPFVENGFKHGVSQQLDHCHLHISLRAEGRRLIFEQENSFVRQPSNQLVGGIGQQNIKKRLELIYQGKYDLKINEVKDEFRVQLVIDLDFAQPSHIARAAEPKKTIPLQELVAG
ncbi:MAG: hypothetical protein JWQ27_236 [Ferruginibacter sp.]|nr:hypothetical protein [Ferruginibacter sp.]